MAGKKYFYFRQKSQKRVTNFVNSSRKDITNFADRLYETIAKFADIGCMKLVAIKLSQISTNECTKNLFRQNIA